MAPHQAAEERVRILQEILELTPELTDRLDYHAMQLILEARQQLLIKIPPPIDEQTARAEPSLGPLIRQASELAKLIVDRDQLLLKEMESMRNRLEQMLRRLGRGSAQPSSEAQIYSRMA